MEADHHQVVSSQPIASGHDRDRMPGQKDPFLKVRPICHPRNDEARPLPGHCGIGIVRQFGTEIDLEKTHGVHGRRRDALAVGSWDSEARLTFRSIGLSWSTSGLL
jgi:hypothetical protein